MKPQVPDILVQTYKNIDPAAEKLTMDTFAFPPVGRVYRDNTNGVVWKILAYSGNDVYEPGTNSRVNYPVSLHQQKSLREVFVILQAVNNESLLMHLKPEDLEQEILSLDHYKVVMKDSPRVPRFEVVEFAEDIDAPEEPKSVKIMSIDKTLRKLADPLNTSLYLLNVYPTPHGLAELSIEYLDNNAAQRPQIAKILATWIPQDILALIPREALLNSQTFRRYLENGYVLPITRGSAKLIKVTPEYEKEAARLAEMQVKVKTNPRYGMF